MQRPGGGGHYDPNQPRVPAGDPRGGQFASKGYRGGDSGRDAGVMRASLDGTQFAELGQGNRGDAREPFEGQFGYIDAGQYLASEIAFEQIATAAGKTRATTSKPGGTDSCRRDPTRANQSRAARDGLSRQPPMLMTTRQARMPQFRQLLRVQSSSSSTTASWSSRQSILELVGDERGLETLVTSRLRSRPHE